MQNALDDCDEVMMVEVDLARDHLNQATQQDLAGIRLDPLLILKNTVKRIDLVS